MSNNARGESVLVLDGETCPALAITRSLGRKGLRVHIGSNKAHPIAAQSRYCSRHFVYPDSMIDALAFREVLLRELQQHSYSLVIPVTDLTVCPLMEIRQSIEAFSPLAMAPNEALLVTLHKSRTYDLARTVGIPIPKTLVVGHLEELCQVRDTVTYPVVIKADRSLTWLSDKRCYFAPVTYAFDAKELHHKSSQFLSLGPVVLQEYVQGEGIGLAVLSSRGRISVAFQYRRLHEVPLTGGGSSYRVSEAITPALLDYASSLLESLCWDGVAMVEFKIDRNGKKAYLMEINGRFWGSLPLALAAHADFPSYLFDLVVRQRRDFPTTYKVGVRCRQLSREFEWLKQVLLRKGNISTVIEFPAYRKILADSCRLLAERTDTWDVWDPRPGIREIYEILRKAVEDVHKKVSYFLEMRRMRRIQRHPKPLIEKLRCAKIILIVCSGNIIRSPFAAHLLGLSVENKASVSVYSAGLDAVPGRQAHPSAVSKAESLGFDLSHHRSLTLTADMVEQADIIFAMEFAHLSLMLRRFPGFQKKTFLLGCLLRGPSLEILDPVFKEEADYDACFGHIARALKPMVSILSGDHKLQNCQGSCPEPDLST